MSGVVVPTTMKSMSCGVSPACAIALSAASFARSDVATPGIDDVALANARALKNPLVGRVDQLLEIFVREQTRRDVGREAADFRRTIAGVLHHKPLPGAVNPK